VSIGALSGRGPLPLIRIPQNTKINADRYIADVLTPLVEKDIPKLYPGEEDKVFIHHEKASSHTAKKTRQYAEAVKENFGPEIIPNAEIPVKSPDIVHLDSFGTVFVKQRAFLKKRNFAKAFVTLSTVSETESPLKNADKCLIHGKNDADL